METVFRRKSVIQPSKRTYSQSIKGMFGSSIIAFWPLTEQLGSTAFDIVNGRNGSYVGVDLSTTPGPKGSGAPFFDGTNDYVNIFGASLASAFNGAAGTFQAWFKVSAASVWTDGTVRVIGRFLADGNNFVDILKPASNNQIQFRYKAGVVAAASVVTNVSSPTGWVSVGITWDKNANEVKAYVNGVQVETTQTASGVWAGAPAAATTNLGVATQAPTSPWKGWLAQSLLLNRAATPAEMGRASGNT